MTNSVKVQILNKKSIVHSVTIPAKIVKKLQIKAGDRLFVTEMEGSIIYKKEV